LSLEKRATSAINTVVMDPPAYTAAAHKSETVWDTRMKIIVGLDYGTTNSGREI